MSTSYPFKPIVTNGLVLYLDVPNKKSFSGVNIWYDLTNNSNNASLSTTQSSISLANSIIFDGMSGYGTMSSSTSLELTSTGSISGWIKISSSPNSFGTIIAKRIGSAASDFDYQVDLDSSGTNLRGSISDGSTIDTINGTTTLNTDIWYQFTFVWDGSFLNIYLNGVSDATPVSQTINAQVTSNPLEIGRGNGIPTFYFKGNIEQLLVYNKALSQSEITNIYNLTVRRFRDSFDIPTTILPAIIPIITTGLVLNLDAGNLTSYPGTGTDWFDLTVNNNDTILINGPVYSSLNGGSLVFDGVSTYGTMSYNSGFDLSSTDFTLECWFNSNSFSSPQILISKDTNGSNFDWCLYMPNSTTLSIYSNSTTTNVTATVPTMNTGQWYHFVVTSVSGVIRIYLDGVLYQTSTMSISNSNTIQLTVGCASWNLPNTFTNGKISIIRLYGIGLTGTEVLQNYNAIKNRY